MKRTAMKPRSKPLRANPKQAKAWKDRSRKPLKPNPARQAKRDAKMKRWYASAEWKRQRQESLELAGHRCQYVLPMIGTRCGVRAADGSVLQVHELRYKFEKSEPKDRVVLCAAHHQYIETTQHPTRRRSQRKGGGL